MPLPLLMCRSCGYFVPAVEADGGLRPLREVCPQCDATDFVDFRDD
ncbi:MULTISPECIES: hypothetical protein [Halorussus]|nr:MULTISPECIES: hypothetical protein [Halorussus]NHN61442.1 hypothetical protein [Halorussus sp. JP-T4]